MQLNAEVGLFTKPSIQGVNTVLTCSVVIPVHNEAENLLKFINCFRDKLANRGNQIIEIILMENGSTDSSFKYCNDLERMFPDLVKAYHLSIPSYGEAIKQGIIRSRGDAVSILECDMLDIDFLSASLDAIEEGNADFVLASKRHSESIDRRPFKRRALTFLFNTYLNVFFRFPGKDTHGLKTIRSDVAKKLCSISITDGEVLQTEIVLLAYRMGYNVFEIPIRIEEQRETSVSIKKRLPKFITIVHDLKKSLKRFPDDSL
jgi:glycosyltransferase involved in cell wall biosynthesis